MNLKKKLLTMMVGMVLSLSLIPSSALAVDAPTPITSGDMTIQSGKTYSISDYTQLYYFARIVNGTGGLAAQSCYGATFILTADIDCAHTWESIGSGGTPFEGTFDGQGYTVSSMTLFTTPSDPIDVGFFSKTYSAAIIKNLNVSGTLSVDGSDHAVGGVVGYNSGATIQNCGSSVNLYSDSYAHFGGIVGYNYGGTIEGCTYQGTNLGTGSARAGGIVGTSHDGLIEDCTNGGIIENAGTTGGIAGSVDCTTTSYCIRNCENLNAVECTESNYAGGIAGKNLGGIIVACVNYGEVSSPYSTYLGGIVGGNGDNTFTDSIIRNCVNEGPLSSTSVCGGIVGSSYGTVQNCYNRGLITNGSRVAGIVASVALGVVENCYSVGILSGSTNPIGGVVAWNDATVRNCYWLSTTAGDGVADGTAGTDVVAFAASGSGTLATSVTISGYSATNSLLSILNNWVAENAKTTPGLARWSTNDSGYTYPIFDQWTQLAGSNRYGTMAAIVAEGFASADTVIIATGANYPDALAAAGLAGIENAPIILTASATLSPQASSEISRLQPDEAIVIGGPSAVSADTFAQIEALMGDGDVTRVQGDNRYKTALAIYDAGDTWSRTAIVATGYGFADALSISPYAFAHESPVFLTGGANGTTGLDDVTKAALTTTNFDQVIIVGGPNAVSEDTETYLNDIFGDDDVVRLQGDNRYKTSAAIATYVLDNDNLGANKMAVATGLNFPDALAGSTLCGKNTSVLLLIDDTDKGLFCVDGIIADNKADIHQGYFLGGDNAISLVLQAKVRAACE